MSVRLMSLVFENQVLSPTEKLVMLALADHANDEGKSIYPSQSRLSRKTGLARGTVNRHIASLMERGYIRKSKVRKDLSNVLELEITSKLTEDLSPDLSTDEPEGVTQDDTSDGEVSQRITPRCDGELHPGVMQGDTNHHVNHQIKQRSEDDLLIQFEQVTEIYRPPEDENPKQNARWLAEAEKWSKLGATAADITEAIEQADQRGTTLSWPGSITAYLTSTISRRKREVKQNPAENGWKKWLKNGQKTPSGEDYRESWLGTRSV